MKSKRILSKLFSFLILVGLLLTQTTESSVSAQDDLPPATPSPSPIEPAVPLPDDIMISNQGDSDSGLALNESSTTNYSVLPIMFVPSDLTPNPNGLRYIDQRMQLIQRWYAEQLRGRTFTLQPAILVRGSQPLSSYYGNCFPPDDCGWGYELWDHIFADLPAQGYPFQSDLVRGVFFQHDGMGAPALGGGGNFLVALDADNNRPNADCLEPGCASSVAKGGVAHELGHAVGLPHTLDDPEGSPGVSLMNYGFYNFPQATLVNTSTNPERDMLFASPFLNIQMSLTDGGFEDCLANWSVISGAANCSGTTKRSGLKALTLSPTTGNNVQVQQQIAASQRTYDISTWINSPDTGNHHVWIQIAALSASAQVLNSQIFGDSVGATNGWQRIAYSFSAPAQTISLRISIHASGSNTTIYVDDVDVHETQLVPPIPLQMFYFDGDTVNGNLPILRWDDVTSSTSYQVQIGVNSSFSAPIWNSNVTSPTFPVPSGLSSDSRYFWRVRALNGTGTSGWSDIWSFVTASPQNYFSDEFEDFDLPGAWSWIREDQAHWHFGGPAGRRGTGYMGITAQEGDLLGANNSAKNLLLKNPPPGNYEISTKIDFWEPGPSINYQQAGLLIYQDDNNYLKLMRTYNNGNKLEWLAEINGVVVQNTTRPIGSIPPIRITKSGNQYSGKYSVDGITWNTLGSPVTVNWNSPKIGLAAFSTLNVQQINAYFDYFRVTSQLTISGTTGVGGTTLSYNDGTPKTVTADGSGNYSISVPPGWSGTITPSQTCYTFNPSNRSYSNLNTSQTAQNYTATFNSALGCADIDVLIAGNNMGSYVLSGGNSLREGYAGVDDGPARIVSTNGVDILSALRVIWKEPGPRYSYSEMMGLPKEQLSNEYWFPWYNNAAINSMDQGFRIANVDTASGNTVEVWVGNTKLETVSLPAGESTRVGYTVDNGPVRIVCTTCTNTGNDKIIAALRVIWKEPGFRASYSEMMGLPKEQLSSEYWFPWYNNAVPASMDQGFRIANVSLTESNTVEVRLGNSILDTINLDMGGSVRVAYNVDNGPIKIVCATCTNTGSDKIIAALRVIWKEPGFRASYSEMMGLPTEQLSSQYWFPWYNNAVPSSMDQGFRIANISTTESNTVEVWVGSTKLATISLGAGGSTRVGYNVDNGPIRIVCTTCTNTGSDKILAALRVIWKEPGFRASYSEMMGLPHEALSTEYWFPWYNFAAPTSMDQGFRIAVP